MYTIEAVVRDEVGLHARPASKFVKVAARFQSDIKIRKETDESDFNAKSITAVLRMGAVKDTKVVITASGPDEEMACRSLKEQIEQPT
ncbi:HPr family phosphocarrier protein [Oscillospiraceae bacterium LTW-04]|nr:HPr family phosphocarrier protein [Oscillospiraceae bacterium MB24-C1]